MKPSGRVLRSVSAILAGRRVSASSHPCQGSGPLNSLRLEEEERSRGLPKFEGGWWRGVQEQPCPVRALPAAKMQRRGFLSCGDGDEDRGLSKHYEEHRIIGYSPEQLFAVVAAVDLYEDFVPWCQKSQVLKRCDDTLDAELEIGFKFFVERYISHVQLKGPQLIKTSVSQSNLFDFLNNEWVFNPGPTPNSCNLHFSVDFQFRSPLYRQVANMFFHEVQAPLVGSFENRCKTVYGPNLVVATR